MPHITLGSWFTKRAHLSPEKPALTFEGTTRTYAELQDRMSRLARSLKQGGTQIGDRVAFLGLNQPAFLETLFAVAQIGAAFLPINHRLAPEEIAYIIQDAGVHTLIVDKENWQKWADSDVRLPRVIIVEEQYEALLQETQPAKDFEPVDSESMAILMYTSGTTGNPKGVMLTHANLWWGSMNLNSLVDVLANDVTLAMAPLFHIAGLNVTTLLTWMRGGQVLLNRAFNVDQVLHDIEKYRVNTAFGVPAMFDMLAQSDKFEVADLSSLRMLNCGGAPVPEPLLRKYLGRGINVQQGYGLTESSPTASVLSADWSLKKLGSAGRAPLYGEISLVQGEQTISEPGVRGEICLRGPHITKGYWNLPTASEEAIDQRGWFHTGDIGYFDEDGFLFIVDRMKDMIISGGENIYPAEIENVLHSHPDILEVAVVGIHDEKWGETVAACVVLRTGSVLDLVGLHEFAEGRLARFKLPRVLKTVTSLPRTASGKVMKTKIRSLFEVDE